MGDAVAVAARPPPASVAVARVVFCTVLEAELRRQAEMSEPSSKDKDLEMLQPMYVSEASFEKLVSLFKSFLDSYQKDDDPSCTGRLLAFLKLVYCTIGGKDVTVLIRVYNHPLWSSV